MGMPMEPEDTTTNTRFFCGFAEDARGNGGHSYRRFYFWKKSEKSRYPSEPFTFPRT